MISTKKLKNIMRVVFPITPSFNNNEEIEIQPVIDYIQYIDDQYTKNTIGTKKKNEVSTIMTTAGTTQFNLLTNDEIRKINITTVNNSRNVPIIGIPAKSLQESIQEIKYYESQLTIPFYPMLLFPDRFYTEEQIISFFSKIADNSKNPIYIHGMWMRKGNGGTWDYTASVINKLAQHPNIKGMKEETLSLILAASILEEVTEYFDIIVAGGSMKRHWNLSNYRGDISFLSGVGSLFPNIAKKYTNDWNMNGIYEARKVMNNYEQPLFKTFMSIGWHASFRYALYNLGLLNKYNRQPFINLNEEQKDSITTIINEIKSKLK